MIRARREELAIAFFGSWMLTGLFLDGWAHQAEKPETFFSPWHGVLYSGFAAAVVWFGIDGIRAGQRLREAVMGPTDRLVALGLALFVTGAVGDGVWHEIFGIEVDLEALLSPTHLLLMIGGFLMLTGPLRAALADPSEEAATFRGFLPIIVTVTLATALISFFTMYLSAFFGAGTYWADGGGDVAELTEVTGVGSILVTNMLLLTPVLFLLRRWALPFGTCTFLFSVVGIGMTGLDGFERLELAAPAVLAGVVADLLVSRRADARLIGAVVPLALWSGFFAAVEVSDGIEWAPELVAGSVTLTVVSGLLLAVVLSAAGVARPGGLAVGAAEDLLAGLPYRDTEEHGERIEAERGVGAGRDRDDLAVAVQQRTALEGGTDRRVVLDASRRDVGDEALADRSARPAQP